MTTLFLIAHHLVWGNNRSRYEQIISDKATMTLKPRTKSLRFLIRKYVEIFMHRTLLYFFTGSVAPLSLIELFIMYLFQQNICIQYNNIKSHLYSIDFIIIIIKVKSI